METFLAVLEGIGANGIPILIVFLAWKEAKDGRDWSKTMFWVICALKVYVEIQAFMSGTPTLATYVDLTVCVGVFVFGWIRIQVALKEYKEDAERKNANRPAIHYGNGVKNAAEEPEENTENENGSDLELNSEDKKKLLRELLEEGILTEEQYQRKMEQLED